MNKFCFALLLLPLAHTAASAQTAAGDPQAGKAFWDGALTQCRNCHGAAGEGAFGPDLAGRKLSAAQFRQALRKPWGVMPAYVDTQVSDAEIGNLVAYFDTLPARDAPGKWRFEAPANAPRGQAVATNMGCVQCHGPALNGPRANLGAVDGDFDYFKNLVYNHTTAYPQHTALLGERGPPRLRMGNFNPARLYESELKEVYDWARNDLGFRVNVAGRLSAGAAAANGVTYTLSVDNIGLPGKAKTAEDLTIRLIVPAGVNVVAATGDGYKGVSVDEKSKANVAVWQVASIAPKAKQTYTITLSKAGTAADNLRGDIHWTKPLKTGTSDEAAIAPAPL
jgi:mono/diheme cytochrome c family protein